MGYGAPHEAVRPRTSPGLPLSCTAVFAAASGGRCLRTLHGYSPRFTHAPSSPLPRVQGMGREVPALGHGTCGLPPSVLPMLPDSAFPPTRFQSSGYSSRSTGDPLQAGRSEQRGSCTLPVTGLAIVRPRLVSGQRGIQSLSAPWYLAIPSAPACSARVIGIWVLPIPRPGLAPGFPRPALGVCP